MEPLPPDPIDDGDPLDRSNTDEINAPPDMPDSDSEDSFVDIGRDAALDQLKSVRKVLKSEAFQDRVVEVLNEKVDIPMVPEALEATAFDTVYDFVQQVSVGAVDRLIASLKA